MNRILNGAARVVDRRGRRFKGFTLLELILVLAIVATLLSVVTPTLRAFYAESEVKDAAVHFMTICEQARVRAISEARVYRIYVDLDEQTYWMRRQGEAGGFERPATELGRTFAVGSTVLLSWEWALTATGERMITFYPDGSAEPIEVVFVGQRGHAVAVVGRSTSRSLRMVELEENRIAHSSDRGM